MRSVGPATPAFRANMVTRRALTTHRKRMATTARSAPKSRSASFGDLNDGTVHGRNRRGHHHSVGGTRQTKDQRDTRTDYPCPHACLLLIQSRTSIRSVGELVLLGSCPGNVPTGSRFLTSCIRAREFRHVFTYSVSWSWSAGRAVMPVPLSERIGAATLAIRISDQSTFGECDMRGRASAPARPPARRRAVCHCRSIAVMTRAATRPSAQRGWRLIDRR
jgi:hypothetical protein